MSVAVNKREPLGLLVPLFFPTQPEQTFVPWRLDVLKALANAVGGVETRFAERILACFAHIGGYLNAALNAVEVSPRERLDNPGLKPHDVVGMEVAFGMGKFVTVVAEDVVTALRTFDGAELPVALHTNLRPHLEFFVDVEVLVLGHLVLNRADKQGLGLHFHLVLSIVAGFTERKLAFFAPNFSGAFCTSTRGTAVGTRFAGSDFFGHVASLDGVVVYPVEAFVAKARIAILAFQHRIALEAVRA